jgi:cell pole-organizing protein PopZ
MMNKPATKEPSMDEILSSIRQNIADDDAAAAPRPSPAGFGLAEVPATGGPMTGFGGVEAEPLALSAEQIVTTGAAPEPGPVDVGAYVAKVTAGVESAPESPTMAGQAEFLDPEDITFESEAAEPVEFPDPIPAPAPVVHMAAPPRSPAPEPIPPAPQAAPVRPRPATTAQAAPMPDPQLSSDIAAELLEPATNAAVRANFARLNNLALGNSGLTIEALMREMLRPMLKDWLDEHLPAVVERMVEKEISRISRGVE